MEQEGLKPQLCIYYGLCPRGKRKIGTQTELIILPLCHWIQICLDFHFKKQAILRKKSCHFSVFVGVLLYELCRFRERSYTWQFLLEFYSKTTVSCLWIAFLETVQSPARLSSCALSVGPGRTQLFWNPHTEFCTMLSWLHSSALGMVLAGAWHCLQECVVETHFNREWFDSQVIKHPQTMQIS